AQKCSRVGAQVPLFSALLNYRHSRQPAEPSPEAALAWGGIEMLDSAERTNYPLTVSVDDLGEGFWLTVQAVKPIEPVRIGDYMRTALKQLVGALENAPETEARAIDVLPEAERNELLVEWNATEVEYFAASSRAARSRAAGSLAERCVHELFTAQ